MFESRSFLRLVGLAMLLLAAGCSMFRNSRQIGTGINRENYTRLQTGMTEKQVEAIFGVPAGFHCSGLVTMPFGPNDERLHETHLTDHLVKQSVIDRSARAKMWVSDHGWAIVAFDSSGKVIPTKLTFSDPWLLQSDWRR
jgi:hypothetical protein